MPLGFIEANFLGTVFEGVFYGLYCIIFILYLRVHTSKKCDDRSLLIYPMSSLFVLCTAFFALDLTQEYLIVAQRQGKHNLVVWILNLCTSIIYSFVDVIAQGVLIYRCWVVWNRKLAVVLVPSVLAFISLATSLTLSGWLAAIWPNIDREPPQWYMAIGILSFSLSLTVNAIFTGLLVFKIAKTTLALRHTHAQGKQNYSPLISILIESGLIFFMAQLIWIICFSIPATTNAIGLTGGPITIIYGIIPTTIVVRVTMAATANTVVEGSAMEFAFTDENLPKIISKEGEPKEEYSSLMGKPQSMSSS